MNSCEHALVDAVTGACTFCHASREQVKHDLWKRYGPSLNYPVYATHATPHP